MGHDKRERKREGRRLRRLRQKAGLSLREASRRAGLNPAILSRIENGEQSAERYLIRLAQVLGLAILENADVEQLPVVLQCTWGDMKWATVEDLSAIEKSMGQGESKVLIMNWPQEATEHYKLVIHGARGDWHFPESVAGDTCLAPMEGVITVRPPEGNEGGEIPEHDGNGE